MFCSLLDLLSPALEDSAKDRLLQLVGTYTDTNCCEPTSDIIYTSDMLPGGDNAEVCDDKMEFSHEEDKCPTESIWIKKYGEFHLNYFQKLPAAYQL